MPKVPDASMVTRFNKVQATVNTDPTIKSRTFMAPIKQGYLSSQLQASDVGKSIIPSQSVLATPVWVSPNFKGRIFFNLK